MHSQPPDMSSSGSQDATGVNVIPKRIENSNINNRETENIGILNTIVSAQMVHTTTSTEADDNNNIDNQSSTSSEICANASNGVSDNTHERSELPSSYIPQQILEDSNEEDDELSQSILGVSSVPNGEIFSGSNEVQEEVLEPPGSPSILGMTSCAPTIEDFSVPQEIEVTSTGPPSILGFQIQTSDVVENTNEIDADNMSQSILVPTSSLNMDGSIVSSSTSIPVDVGPSQAKKPKVSPNSDFLLNIQ